MQEDQEQGAQVLKEANVIFQWLLTKVKSDGTNTTSCDGSEAQTTDFRNDTSYRPDKAKTNKLSQENVNDTREGMHLILPESSHSQSVSRRAVERCNDTTDSNVKQKHERKNFSISCDKRNESTIRKIWIETFVRKRIPAGNVDNNFLLHHEMEENLTDESSKLESIFKEMTHIASTRMEPIDLCPEKVKTAIRSWKTCADEKHTILTAKMTERARKRNLAREAHWRRKRIRQLQRRLRRVETKLDKWNKKIRCAGKTGS